MLSDILAEAETAIRNYQIEEAETYGELKGELDALRAKMVALRMRLDNTLPLEWLNQNPIYSAAVAGDVSVNDRYMDGDEGLLDYYRAVLAAQSPRSKTGGEV